MSSGSQSSRPFDREEAERAAMMARLHESDELLQLALRAGKIGVWDWDILQERITWTDSLYAIHGVTREQFDGTAAGFAQLIHPDDRGPVQRALQSSLEHGAPYEL